MADADKKPRDWQAHLIDPRLLLGATTVIILLLAALPFYKDHEALLTPADQARMARQSLRDQLALSQAPDLSTGRDAATSDERQPVTRDIFRPVAAAEAPVLNREGVLSTAAAETAAKGASRDQRTDRLRGRLDQGIQRGGDPQGLGGPRQGQHGATAVARR
jgi:hypothetical protein